jgi:PRTRC genetic system protein C
MKYVRSRFSFVTPEWRQSVPNQHLGEIKMATTTLKTRALPREFVFNGARIPDPNPQMSIDQVRDLLTPSYPEIATCDDDWTGGHRNELALLLLQSHRFEGLSHASV